MALRFGRNFENPEGKIEKVETTIESDLEDPYDDKFDEKMDLYESQQRARTNTFKESIKVEIEHEDTPLSLAYKSLDIARRTNNKEEILKAEALILDLERQEEIEDYRQQMSELDIAEQNLQSLNDTSGLNDIAKSRQKLLRDGKYDELNYKLKKLQIQQRLSPSRTIVEQIRDLQKQLDELYNDDLIL